MSPPAFTGLTPQTLYPSAIASPVCTIQVNALLYLQGLPQKDDSFLVYVSEFMMMGEQVGWAVVTPL